MSLLSMKMGYSNNSDRISKLDPRIDIKFKVMRS